jgi:hypothetical protein
MWASSLVKAPLSQGHIAAGCLWVCYTSEGGIPMAHVPFHSSLLLIHFACRYARSYLGRIPTVRSVLLGKRIIRWTKEPGQDGHLILTLAD